MDNVFIRTVMEDEEADRGFGGMRRVLNLPMESEGSLGSVRDSSVNLQRCLSHRLLRMTGGILRNEEGIRGYGQGKIYL